MKKKLPLATLIILIFLTFFVAPVQAYVCDGSYTIDENDTSGDINAVSGCTEITGNLSIRNTDLTNLNGLANLTSIGGWLVIYENYSLTTLSALNNLTSVGSHLSIIYNDTLLSLTGLNNITNVGSLMIEGNTALISLNGLEGLTSLVSGLYIINNSALTSLSGLNNLTTLGRSLRIIGNSALTSLNGLESLTTVGEVLGEGDNSLELYSNHALINLCALYNVYLAGPILKIYSNSVLSMDTAYALETQLRNNGFTGTADIYGNFGSGLVECIYPGDYLIDHIDTSGDIAGLSGYVGVSGNLLIEGTVLTDLTGLENLTSVGETLEIYNNPSLTSLNGLNNLNSVGESLGIVVNNALTSLNGLNSLNRVGGDLAIIVNNSLKNLCALYKANLEGDFLAIHSQTSLSMETAYALETQLRGNGFTGTADIHDNNGSGLVSCPCNSASVIPSSGTQIIAGNTSGANNDAVPSCRSSSTAPDDLYVFTLDTVTTVTASVSGFDTVLHLREICDDQGSELACNDDNTPPGGLGSRISVTLLPGQYYLIVDGYGSSSGAYDLTVDFGSEIPCGNDGDDICDDGDGNGIAGDYPCTGGDTTSCDDNCPLICNPDQLDADEDGIGDVCDSTPGCGGGCGQSECEESCGGCGG